MPQHVIWQEQVKIKEGCIPECRIVCLPGAVGTPPIATALVGVPANRRHFGMHP
jgi:hypothetical protein